MTFEDACWYVDEAENVERNFYKMLAGVASYPYLKEADRKSFWSSLDKPARRARKVRVGFSPERAEQAKKVEDYMRATYGV